MSNSPYFDGYNPSRILFTMDGMNTDVPPDEYEVDDQLEQALDQWEQEFIQKHHRRPTGDECNAKYLELTGRKDEVPPEMPTDPDIPF